MSNNIIKRSADGSPLFVFGKRDPVALVTIKQQTTEAHKSSMPSKTEEEGKQDWVKWGVTDNFPNEIVKIIRKSTVGKSALHLLTKAIYGQRLITYTVEDYDKNGAEIIKYAYNKEWEEIIARSNFNAVRLALMQDYSYFGFNVPEFIFTKDKTKVYSIDYHKASHCRMAPVNKDGFIPHLYISGNFPDVSKKECLEIPVIDFIRYPSQIAQILEDKKTFKYVMPQLWPDVVNDYYPSVYWDSARESGWLDIATSIPAYKKALFKNQMSLKYDIQIPLEYLKSMHKGFDSLSIDEKDKIIDDLYDDIVDKLTGPENAQKALLSFFSTDSHGKPVGNWVIKTIDDKMRNDAYLPDSSAANSEILFSMLVNPAQTGQGNTGGSYTGGSNNGGSNIREADLTMRSNLQADRDIVYSFFEFIKLYNGLDPKLKLAVQDRVLTTLDTGNEVKITK